jgi:hypothetical protein
MRYIRTTSRPRSSGSETALLVEKHTSLSIAYAVMMAFTAGSTIEPSHYATSMDASCAGTDWSRTSTI